MIRAILGAILEVVPADVPLRLEPSGRPCVAPDLNPRGVRFSLSHGGDVALVAVALDCAVGVDVEKITDDIDIDPIARHSFSPRERAALEAMPRASRREAFFRCWCRKEAFAKANGLGLSMPFDQFDVDVHRGSAALLATRPDAAEAARWTLRDVESGQGYAAAVAVEGTPAAVRRRDFFPWAM